MSVPAAWRYLLALCIGAITLMAPAQRVSSARAGDGSSTWYWQNPLPRPYSVSSIACRSVTSCVAVGADGLIVTTDDGGKHWTDRPSGTTTDLASVTCPGRAICYALGFAITGYGPAWQLEGANSAFLESADGGKTWRQVAASLPASPSQFLSSLTCASAKICLVWGWATSAGPAPVLRTADGGKTWRAESISGPQAFTAITCSTRTICYAAAFISGQTRVLRSGDGGQTWKLRGAHSPQGLSAIVCPAEDTCFATAVSCDECNVGYTYLTSDGARTWKRLYYGATGSIACPSATTCYAGGDRFVFRTTDGGKTWSAHRLPDFPGGMACPSLNTCYMTDLFGVRKTTDGFGHTQETLSRSAIHGQTLTDISCPTTRACFAAGSRNACPDVGPCDQVPASFAATTDGGRTWRATPVTPDVLQRLSCSGARTCLAIGGSNPGPVAVYRSDDGARTWYQTTWQQISSRLLNGQASDITCVGGSTCYLLATVAEDLQGNNGIVQRAAVLVSHDAGKTWNLQTGIDAAARAELPTASIPIQPTRIACPAVMTCFVLTTVYVPVTSPTQPYTRLVLLSTTDDGASWTPHAMPPDNVPYSGYPPLEQDLACPSVTTCYLLSYTQNSEAGNPNGLPGPVLVTHDAGATWQSSVVGSGEYLIAIGCSSAQSCYVSGSSGLFGTSDGGMSWQRQSLADGTPVPPMASISCPAVGSCYAVGGPEPCCALMIMGTHPPGAALSASRDIALPVSHAS